MTFMRDKQIVERVKEATDLVALVGQAVKLRKQGNAWVGLCPFHAEKSPSFQVVPDRGFYHCFGCGKNGDALTWLQEREGLNFREALEHLAEAAGIDLPRTRGRSDGEADLEGKLRSLLEAAQSFYTSQLQRSPEALAYLRDRGFHGAFIQEAGFGFAPEGYEVLLHALKGQGLSLDSAEQAGLTARNDSGQLRDFLRNRITIPIRDSRGKLVGFGGRALGEQKAKYLNTRETALFRKSELLFGLHLAKGAMKEGALVVEGYFDVLQLHQQGVHQAVAPMGTALTDTHIQQLKRFSRRITLCFDADAAGKRAMEKALRLCLPVGFDVRLLELPSGEDPDTWCLQVGGEAFKHIVRHAPGWAEFILGRKLEGRDLRRVSDRMEAFGELKEFLPFLPQGAEGRELLVGLAHQLQLPVQEIQRAAVAPLSPQLPASPSLSPKALPPIHELVRDLLALAQDAQGRSWIASLPLTWWEGLSGAPLLFQVLEADGDLEALSPELISIVRAMEARRAQTEIRPLPERVRLKLEQDFLQRELQELGRRLTQPSVAADPEQQQRLEQEQWALIVRSKKVAQELRSLGFMR